MINECLNLWISSRLDILSNQSLRQKYWRIYYGDEEYERRCSNEFSSDEMKRLSNVSQRIKQIQHNEEFSHLLSSHTPQSSPDLSLSSFLAKFRRGRSTSFPFVNFHSNTIQKSLDILTETPLCKPVSPRS